jgi:photosynthetic reaction center H subunit
METGSITGYIDVAQVVLYLFWAFFAGLIYYLHRENKREGYPLESETPGGPTVEGFPGAPPPKTYRLMHGHGERVIANNPDRRPVKATPVSRAAGSPLQPDGDPMLDGVGPAAWAERHDDPDLTLDGKPKIVPLRVATEFVVHGSDPDPRGKPVIAADGQVAGTVTDVWVDLSEPQIRYFEAEVPADGGKRRALIPAGFAKVDRTGTIKVQSLLARHFARIPALAKPDQVTLLEEDKICAYFGGGTLYAEPERQEPCI